MSRMQEQRQPRRRGKLWLTGLLPSLLLLPLLCRGQEGKFVHHPFESRELAWLAGPADAQYRQTAHRMTEETAHEVEVECAGDGFGEQQPLGREGWS